MTVGKPPPPFEVLPLGRGGAIWENVTYMQSQQHNLEPLFERLTKSKFRSRFKLGSKESQYLADKGFAEIEQHARDFVTGRLAPAYPNNDGKQTPMRNHPVFIAQHATATCCRGCLKKWHNIDTGKLLTVQQIDYIITVILHWLRRQ